MYTYENAEALMSFAFLVSPTFEVIKNNNILLFVRNYGQENHKQNVNINYKKAHCIVEHTDTHL